MEKPGYLTTEHAVTWGAKALQVALILVGFWQAHGQDVIQAVATLSTAIAGCVTVWRTAAGYVQSRTQVKTSMAGLAQLASLVAAKSPSPSAPLP